MKKDVFKREVLVVLCSLVLVSCETGEPSETPERGGTPAGVVPKSANAARGDSASAFDHAGSMHTEVLLGYYADTLLPATADGCIARLDAVVAVHPYFAGFSPADYGLVPEGRILAIADNGPAELAVLMDELPLSLQAREGLYLFVTEVLEREVQGEAEAELHAFMVGYEGNVLSSNTYTDTEKEYLLTVASILRHSVQAKRKRPKKNTDIDWDWLTANVAGAALGAQYGPRQAILTAARAGILENR